MAAGPELFDFKANLTETRANVRDLRNRVDAVGDTVEDVRQALEAAGKVKVASN